jgi:hypothetical protein
MKGGISGLEIADPSHWQTEGAENYQSTGRRAKGEMSDNHQRFFGQCRELVIGTNVQRRRGEVG